jgi:hypothetical protein
MVAGISFDSRKVEISFVREVSIVAIENEMIGFEYAVIFRR